MVLLAACLPDFNHGLARLHEAADMLADLSVGLSRLSEVVPHLLIGLVQSPPLLGTHPPHCAASGRGGAGTTARFNQGRGCRRLTGGEVPDD